MSAKLRKRVPMAAIGMLASAILLSSYVLSQWAFATHQPADKVVAAGNNVAPIEAGTEVTLLTATLRTSKPTDLMIHVTYECSLLTKLTTGPSTTGGATDTANASASIRSWVEIETNGVTRIVPISAASSPPQEGSTPNSGTKAQDGVTFCDRTYERTVTDGESPQDGLDEEEDYIRTKTANAFNWVLLNAGSGIHTVRLKADIAEAGPCAAATNTNQTCSDGFVGNRTMIIEPAKLANDATIAG